MDLVSHPLFVSVLTICFLGVARSSNDDKVKCPCSEIRHIPLTKPPPKTCLETMFRYTCVDGYLRQVGTSNLIKCKRINGTPQWTPPALQCIPDPRRTTTHLPETTVTSFSTAPHTTLGESSISASVATETYGTLSTSPAVHTDMEFVSETSATDRTTSNSSNQNSNTTLTPHVLTYTDDKLDKTTTVVIVCIALVIICALIGVSYACYRRRSRNPPASVEEMTYMNTSADPAP
ncbi:interleukin-15 receptor subunit alpha isoform X2 [Solea solea]|uniref:interleukin-15 receptor subunit alpha isoform X2 n=1 Tax=Solea solea TaxID=90069 RepID=UPI00272CF370|nr:interleukin-15 receptor subunit alpha isoform X2 [Solea solea]